MAANGSVFGGRVTLSLNLAFGSVEMWWRMDVLILSEDEYLTDEMVG